MSNRARRVWRTLESLAWLAVFGFVGYRLWPQVAAALDVGPPGEHAPEFALTSLAGEPVALEDLRGRVVLVNFWATWCPPCRFEMPGFERVYRDRRDQGFVVVGVSTDRAGIAAVERFLAERGITFPVAMASGGIQEEFGGIRGLPTSFLIDRKGRIRHRVYGVFAEPALRLAVDHLLQEEAPASVPDGADGGGR